MKTKRMDDFSSQVHDDVDKDIHHQDVISDQNLDRVKDHGGEMTKGGLAAVGVLSGAGMWCILGLKNMLMDYVAQVKEYGSLVGPQMKTFTQSLPSLTKLNTIIWVGAAGLIGIAAYSSWLKTSRRGLAALDGMKDKNDYRKDNHIMFLSEMLDKYEIYPDLGASADIMPTGLMAHIMLKDKGIKPVVLNEFDGLDPIDGKGKKVPLINTGVAADFYKTSNTPKKYCTPVDPSKERNYKGEPTMADYINKHWTFDSEIEPQRPAGAYIVNTAPINVILIAMTRAGKGQTYIEVMIDLWMRCNPDIRPNIIINDPKGELLVKKYVTANMRGFRPWRIDLLNPLATDIYNPLWDATQFARDKDYISAAALIQNIGSVFFPDTGGEKLWTEGPKASFERMAYILIYEGLKNERLKIKEKKKKIAEGKTKSKSTFLTPDEIDDVYGSVTLLEVYKTFNTLANTYVKNPRTVIQNKYIDPATKQFKSEQAQEQYEEEIELVQPIIDLFDTFDDPNKATALDLYCAAIREFPRVGVISEIVNSHDSLRAMAKADKTISSVYGIALSSLKFFTDRTVSALTSGLPSQNINIQSFAFPRRVGMQFDATFARRNHYIGKLTQFEAFKDPECTQSLGKKFKHTDNVTMFYWTNFFFEGMLSDVGLETIYIKCDIISETTRDIVDTYYFRFKKGYKHDYNGRHYVLNPVTGDKIAQDGIVEEYEIKTNKKTGKKMVVSKQSEYNYMKDRNGKFDKRPVFQNLTAKYQEGQNIMWLVTPPNMATYARLVLIMLKQLIDSNFGLAYMTKDNQKPMYPTMFMLDELGNLKSDGAGIQGLDTDLSIGLGQGQHFTLILQTLAQFTSVYGDDVEPILQSNSSQLTFLKSNDTQMLERLEKLSGTVHRMHLTGGSVSEDRARIIRRGESNINYNWSFEAEPCVTFNDMAQLPERNAITFNAGDSVVWARNDTALPMSWKLFSNSINDGMKYALKTLPNMSTVKHVDYGLINFNPAIFVEDTLTRLMYLKQAKITTETKYNRNKNLVFDSTDSAEMIDDVLDEILERPSTYWFDISTSDLVLDMSKVSVAPESEGGLSDDALMGLMAMQESGTSVPLIGADGSMENDNQADTDDRFDSMFSPQMVDDTKTAFIEAVCFSMGVKDGLYQKKDLAKDSVLSQGWHYYLDDLKLSSKSINGFVANGNDVKKAFSIDLTGGKHIPDAVIPMILKECRSGRSLLEACIRAANGEDGVGNEYRDWIVMNSYVNGKYIDTYIKEAGHFFFTKGSDQLRFINYFCERIKPANKM